MNYSPTTPEAASRPHSWLFHVPPLGVGTKEIESLSGYISRIARAHCVTPVDLLHRTIEWWDQGKPDRVGEWCPSSVRLKLNGTVNAHATGRWWIALLEKLGCVTGLSECTVSAWCSVVASAKLLKMDHRWCPECYRSDADPYDRLLWSVHSVKACPKHRCDLVQNCPSCRSSIPTLHGRSSPGYCPRCSASLYDDPSRKAASQQDIKHAEMVAAFIADTSCDRIRKIPLKDTFTTSLNLCATAASLSDASELAAWLGTSRITAWYWIRGKATPRFENLVGICKAFGVSISDYLGGLIPEKISLHDRDELPLRTMRAAPRKFDEVRVYSEIQRLREAAVNEPLDLSQIETVTGFDRRILRRYFPALCREITARRKKYVQVKIGERRATLREEFRHALRQSRSDGQNPSRKAAIRLLSHPGVLRNAAIRRDFDQLFLELG